MGPLGVKFWGTRGLVSSPRQETAVFGGNTPCVQILYKDHLILIDTGFGCANLGDHLMQRILANKESLHVHVFYTHFHWDHIQGLPFFKPIYFDSTTIDLYSPEPSEKTYESLNILFDGSYSPFESLKTMPATSRLNQLKGPLDLDGLKVEFHPVDHGEALVSDTAYAYRLTAPDQTSVTLITDHEARSSKVNSSLCAFAQGTGLLIHDGQFSKEEYLGHRGEGHSSVDQALDNARRIGAGLTLLTHHDPSRNDKEIQALHRALLRVPRFRPLNFDFAREEIVYVAQRVKPLSEAG